MSNLTLSVADLIVITDTLCGSLRIGDSDGRAFAFDHETRQKMLSELLHKAEALTLKCNTIGDGDDGHRAETEVPDGVME